jgi:hypothetical protein
MTSFPIIPSLTPALVIVVTMLYLLGFASVALIVGIVWSRRRTSRSRGPTICLRLALGSSSFLFVTTAALGAFAVLSGFYRGPLDFFSMAFWPTISGIIAFVACRQLRRDRVALSERSTNDKTETPLS